MVVTDPWRSRHTTWFLLKAAASSLEHRLIYQVGCFGDVL